MSALPLNINGVAKLEKRMGRAQWVQAARNAISKDGMDALSVEALAKRLRVTKGSFYWHFKNRDALLGAVLSEWEETATNAIVSELSLIADPRERLLRLYRVTSAARRDRALYVALGSVRSDAIVASSLSRVAKRRITFLSKAFREIGLPLRKAQYRALLAYTSYVGFLHLLHEAPDALPNERLFRAFLKDQLAILLSG